MSWFIATVGLILGSFFAAYWMYLQLEERVDKKMSELDDVLSSITIQLSKAKSEIISRIDDLVTQVASGGVSQETLDALRAAAQSLDDVVPDVSPPVEEPPVEEPPNEL